MVKTRRLKLYDDMGDELPATAVGIAALQPQPMTPEQVRDLVERTRAADIAAGLSQDVQARIIAGARRGGQERARRNQAGRSAGQSDGDAHERYLRLTSGTNRRR